MQNFRALGAPPPDPQLAPHCEFLATRLTTSHADFLCLVSEVSYSIKRA